MKEIKADLLKLFQNNTVLDIFSNSDGQGLIFTAEIERKLSLDEILELEETLFSPDLQLFIIKYSDYPNIQNFINFFAVRVAEIAEQYRESGKMETPLTVATNNVKKISKKFPNKSSLDACKEFIELYQKKHKELGSYSFEQAKDFFDNPVAWV